MCKRFLGIFKRRKREFSDEELNWQKNIIHFLYFVILLIVIAFTIISQDKISTIICCVISVFIVVYLKIVLIEVNEEITFRNRRNTRKEILQKIENDELSDLNILNEEIIQEMFKECLTRGVIEITRKNYGIDVTINRKDFLYGKNFFITTHDSTILEYFSIKE